MKHSEDMDLKRVLFSLKTFFQSDKDLVYEFVKEGGLCLLIDLGMFLYKMSIITIFINKFLKQNLAHNLIFWGACQKA